MSTLKKKKKVCVTDEEWSCVATTLLFWSITETSVKEEKKSWDGVVV